MNKLFIVALVGFGFCAGAQTVSVKSPDGKNEIRLDPVECIYEFACLLVAYSVVGNVTIVFNSLT